MKEALDDATHDNGQAEESGERRGKKKRRRKVTSQTTHLFCVRVLLSLIRRSAQKRVRKITRCMGVSHGCMHMTCLCRSMFPSFFVFNDVMGDSSVDSVLLYSIYVVSRARERGGEREKRTRIDITPRHDVPLHIVLHFHAKFDGARGCGNRLLRLNIAAMIEQCQ